MARTEREYRRLPGRGRKRGSFFALTATRSSVWAGRDHLLLVSGTGYTEEYKRFYYRDIQAIVIRKTGRGAAWSGFSALVLALLVLLALTRTATSTDALFWFWTLSLGGCFLLALIVNLLRGPTCICHLHTAVSREELSSLSRERNAKKALDILKPLIEGAQGALTREEITARSADVLRQPAPAALSRAAAQGTGMLSGYNGKVHEVLASLLLADGLLSAITIFVRSFPLAIMGTLLSLALAITVIVALTKQHESALKRGLRGVTWTSFIYLIVTFVMSYFIGIYEFLRNPEVAGRSQWEMFKILSQASPADNRALMYTLLFSVVCATVLGISSLVLIRRFQAERRSASGDVPVSADDTASA